MQSADGECTGRKKPMKITRGEITEMDEDEQEFCFVEAYEELSEYEKVYYYILRI